MTSSARVLIIENHDALRVLLFTILRHQPLAVDTATTADEAIEHIETCDYALIFIDLGLPDGQSLDFLRRFRSMRPDANTFVLAARDPKELPDLDPSIVSAVVMKPLELNTIAEAIRECALVVEPSPESGPMECPPAESEIKQQMERGGDTIAN